MNEKESNKNDWLGRLGQMVGLKPQQAGVVKILAAGLFIGILFIQAPAFFGVGENSSSQRPPDATEVTAPADPPRDELSRMEREIAGNLERTLSRIAGAGEVHVSVTLAAGPRVTPLTNVREDKTTTKEDATDGSRRTTDTTSRDVTNVMTKNGSADVPAVASRSRAEIAGVLIVAQGARDATVRANLFYAAAGELGIPAHRVTVYPAERRQ